MALLAVSAFGQGQVSFNTRDTINGILAQVTYKSTGVAVSGTEGRIALLGGPAATGIGASTAGAGNLKMLVSGGSSGASWVNFGTSAATKGYAAVGTDKTRVLTDVNYSSSAMLQLVAWTGNATDWASAYAAALQDPTLLVGWSATWNVTTTTGPIDTGFAINTGMAGFTIQPIPEPATMALAGLGAAALLIFRRRK